MLEEHAEVSRCAVLPQVALATIKVPAAERLSAHLLIHESPEHRGESTSG